MEKSQDTNERRFDRGAKVTLLLFAALLLLAVGSTVYRFTLPTDGWLSVESDEFDEAGYIYQTNVMGAPSGLRPSDHLIAVDSVSLANNWPVALWAIRDRWQVGNTVRYTVVRERQEIQLDVPLTRWNLGEYWRATASISNISSYLGVFLFLVIGLLAFWRRPDSPAARALGGLGVLIFSMSTVTDLVASTVADQLYPAASLSLAFFIFATFSILLPPALIRFALVFPKPVPAVQRHPWLAFLPYVIGVPVFVALVAGIYVAGFIWTAASVFITLVILVYSAMTQRDAISRAQFRWGLGGMVIGMGMFFLTYIPVFFTVPIVLENILNVFSRLSFGVMGIGLGIAVLRYRLFDIDVIIRKTTSYALLTGILALVYFGSIVVLQQLLTPRTGDSDAAVVLSTLLIAALFLPLRRRIQAVIDRRFFRRKYDAEQVLARFAATARDETDLDALTTELVRVIQETMEPESISLWLRPADRKPFQTESND